MGKPAILRERTAFELDVCTKCETVFRRPDPKAVTLMCIKPETRTVFRLPDGRTMLTRKGAYSRHAWLKMREKWPCDGECMIGYDGESTVAAQRCNQDHYDGTPAQRKRLHDRFVRWLMWLDRETRHGRGRAAA